MTSCQPHPQVLGAALGGATGMWSLTENKAQPWLHMPPSGLCTGTTSYRAGGGIQGAGAWAA